MNSNKYNVNKLKNELQTKILFIIAYLLEHKENIPECVYNDIMEIIEGNKENGRTRT